MRASARKGPDKPKPKKKKMGLKEKVRKVGKSLRDNKLNVPEDTLGQEHAAAVETGRVLQQAAQKSTGRAQAMIKAKRV